MFNRNQIRRSDPFQLSMFGWLRAAASWLRGPAFMSRWLLFGLTTLSVLSVTGIAAVLLTVMQPASLALRSVTGASPAAAPTTSPPPEYNFVVLPEVRSSRPLWDLKHPEDPDWKYE